MKTLFTIGAIVILCLALNEDNQVFAQRQRRKRREEERDITASEVEEITDDATIEDDPDELEKKAMMEEWDEHMSDFVPDDMLTVELQAREEIVSNQSFELLI